MICNKCGRSNEENNKYCNYCNTRLDIAKVGSNDQKEEQYDTEEGFSRPDSKYIEPQVLNSEKILRENSNLNQMKQSGIYGDSYANSLKGLYQGLDLGKQQEPNKTIRLSKKSIISILLALLIIVIPLIYLNAINRENGFSFIPQEAIEVYVNHSKFLTYVFNVKGDLLESIEKEVYPIYTPDHTAAVLIAMNGTESYYVDANQMIILQDKITTSNISEDGKYILYTRSGGMNNYFLYLYDIENQKEEVLDNSASKQFDLLNVLPGGKTITFVTYSITEERKVDEIESYIIHDGGEPELVGKDIAIYAISRDGKNIYTYNLKEGALFVAHEGKEIPLSTEVSNNICFNIDHTEIIFNVEDATYLSINGKEKIELADTLVVKILVPKNGFSNVIPNSGMVSYGIDSIRNKVILGRDKSLIYITNKYKTKKIGMAANDPFPNDPVTAISKDGNNLLYIASNNDLVMVHDLSGKWKQNTLANQVDSFATSEDLSQIYYLKENNLYFLKNKEEPVWISDNASSLCMNQAGDTAYFLKNYTDGKGTLYRSLSGNTAEPVQGGEEVISVEEWNRGVIYQKYIKGIFSAFYNSEGKEFTTLADGFYITQ